ncbi:MAG: dTMP kinase [Kiritimatiellia bacterium]
MRGKFITFEGPEGSGKSTHIRKLAQFLEEQGVDLVRTREPGGTPLNEKIRELIQYGEDCEVPCDRCELLLFLACRAQHVDEFIVPELEAGRWVLCDRFHDSTFAYQGCGRGFEKEQIKQLNDFAVNGLNPDLTLLIDVSPETSRQRLKNRHISGIAAPDRIEKEKADFHVRLRNGFLELAEMEPDRFYVVDAERDCNLVQSDIRNIVSERFLTLS